MTGPLSRVVIADRFAVIRRGLRSFVEELGSFRLVGEASTGREALLMVRETDCNVIITDYSMPALGGVSFLNQLKSTCPRTKILIHSDIDQEDIVFEALRAGACGYILKDGAELHLLAALKALSAGQPYLTQRISNLLLNRFFQSDMICDHGLTHREREVVQLIAEGYFNRQVAGYLDISVKTVESHRASAMCKLGLRTTAELVRYAVRQNLTYM